MAITLISTQTLSSSVASFTFSSIPGTYTDLLLVISGRTDSAGYFGYSSLRPNGATTNLSQRRLAGNGSAASSGTNAYIEMGVSASGVTANTFGNLSIYIPNYASTTVQKSISVDMVIENNVTEAYQRLLAGLWASTSAITSLEINGEGSNFVSGTTASLYGITKGSSGGVTVS